MKKLKARSPYDDASSEDDIEVDVGENKDWLRRWGERPDILVR
jgi:hypothetical protein